MKKFISENWYKAVMALSFFILACGVFIYSINSNKAFAQPKKAEFQSKTCVGAVYNQTSGVYVVWSDGTISRPTN